MANIHLEEFFVGEADRCERLVATLQLALECMEGREIATREELEAVE